MSVTHKKLSLQYAYLKLEKEEVDEACISAEPEIRKYMEEHYPEHYRDFYSAPQKPPTQTEPEPPPNDPPDDNHKNKEQPAKNKDLKKLYRKIAEKTHPDKTGSNQYSDLFSQAAEAYSQNNIAVLLEIAGSLNIELADLSPESVLLLENNIKLLAYKIFQKKQTAAWSWNQAKNEEERKKIILLILQNKGVNV